jgi:DNA polymerase-3 subunit gamma/tau
MSYAALYRKFRPNNFAEVKGQDHIVTTLRNQLKLGRIGHAYLFTGTRGTGKTSVAKIMAKAVNCENPNEDGPCGECEMCRKIQAQASVNVVELDAASNNGVDNIREIVDAVQYSPAEGKYKVYIIDEVHMLSTGAFNALLKTLEEPPSYVIFILATTEVNKIPITILSRCQRYDFHRIGIDVIAGQLASLAAKEGIEADDKAIRYIARTADGSMRDGLSLLDQCSAFYLGEKLTYDKVLEVLGAIDTEMFHRILTEIVEGNVKGALRVVEEVSIHGCEIGWFINEWIWYMRNVLLVKASDDCEDMVEMSADNLRLLKEQSETLTEDGLIRYIRVLSELSSKIRYSNQKRVLLEVAVIKLCRPQMETDYESILDRIRLLEEAAERGSFNNSRNGNDGHAELSSDDSQVNNKPKRVIYPSALKEDIRNVSQNWQEIINGMDIALKGIIGGMRLSLAKDDSGLVLTGMDSSSVGIMQIEKNYNALCERVNNYAGKEVPIKIIHITEEENRNGDYPDLTRLINSGIKVEVI